MPCDCNVAYAFRAVLPDVFVAVDGEVVSGFVVARGDDDAVVLSRVAEPVLHQVSHTESCVAVLMMWSNCFRHRLFEYVVGTSPHHLHEQMDGD